MKICTESQLPIYNPYSGYKQKIEICTSCGEKNQNKNNINNYEKILIY